MQDLAQGSIVLIATAAASNLGCYTQAVKRVLQLAVTLLILVPLLWPVTELFDRWDAPGIDNDIEIALFAVLFMLCLSLIVSIVLARLKPVRGLLAYALANPAGRLHPGAASYTLQCICPSASPPLRI